MADDAVEMSETLSLNPSPQGERESASAQGEGRKRTKSDTLRARNLRKNMTDAEVKLWQYLRGDQLDVRFRRQYSIPPYIVDFCCPKRHLIIEVDGGQHNENLKDQERDTILKSKGYTVLRFWNNDVMENIEGVVTTIQQSLNHPPLPPLSKMKEGEENLWRTDFPALSKTMNGEPLAFLDSAASAQKPQCVIDAMTRVMSSGYANIHRGLYEISQNLTQEFESVRSKIAAFIGAPSEKNIVFTRNATEGINLVAQSWGRTFLKSGDEIIITAMEHHANIVPWQLLADQIGIVIKVIPILADGTLDLAAFEKLLSTRTKLIGVVEISNALGTINPINKIIEIARQFNPEIKVLIDGSQGIVHRPVNVTAMDADFYVFTGHKLYAPTGIGVLYGKYDLLQSMPPYQGGGDMIDRVRFSGTTYREAPYKFEAGTPAILEVIGLGAAVDYLVDIGMDKIAAHEETLLHYATNEFKQIKELKIHGTQDLTQKAGIISFTLPYAHPSDIGMILDQCGVAVRTGHHCAMPLMEVLGVDATVRASLALYSDKSDIDALVMALHKAEKMFGE